MFDALTSKTYTCGIHLAAVYAVRVTTRQPTPEERDERLTLPLDPEEALRALLAVDPDSEPRAKERSPGVDAPSTEEVDSQDGVHHTGRGR